MDPYLRQLMECCLDNMPSPFSNFGFFIDSSWKTALMSEACGFNVYNTEPVKQAFAFRVDGKSGQQIAQC